MEKEFLDLSQVEQEPQVLLGVGATLRQALVCILKNLDQPLVYLYVQGPHVVGPFAEGYKRLLDQFKSLRSLRCHQ